MQADECRHVEMPALKHALLLPMERKVVLIALAFFGLDQARIQRM